MGENEDNPVPKAMNNQPVWKRFLTVLAGPGMNFLLGVVITFLFYQLAGVVVNVPVVGSLVEGMPAAEYGLQEGDRFLEVNGTEIPDGEEGMARVQAAVQGSDLTAPVHLAVERDGERIEVDVPLKLTEEGVYQLGIYFGREARHFGPATTAKYTFEYIRYIMREMLTALKNLIFKGEGVEEMSGVVGIVAIMSQEMRRSADTVIAITILITMNLGIMNLLPIPALDGGRLVLLIIEGIRRKPLNRDREAVVILITFVLLLGVMLFFTVKDIIRLIG